MAESKNLTIGMLTITATILLVGVILTSSQNEAKAIGQIDRGGDYILMTGQFTENQELVYVTDGAAKRMNVYSYVATRRAIIIWDTIDLTRLAGERKKDR